MVRPLLILAALLLSGCASQSLYLEYEHGSSIQDYYDRETTDMVGATYSAILCPKRMAGNPYCPELEVSAMWEVTGDPTYGRDPVGQVRIRQPVFVR